MAPDRSLCGYLPVRPRRWFDEALTSGSRARSLWVY